MPDINGPDIHDYICDIFRVGSLSILLGILIYIILRDIPGIYDLVIATYFLGIATLILGAIALLGPKWAEYNLYAPKLKLLFELNPPFCHKTVWLWVEDKVNRSEPVYYFRLRIKNDGKSIAKKCEIVLENLWVYDSENNRKKIHNFSPINLIWVTSAGKRRQYIDINPERGYFCDLGHISSKKYQMIKEMNSFIDADGYPVCMRDDLRFKLDLFQNFNSQSNYLCPKIRYVLEIGLYSGNAHYKNVFFEISFSGKWEDDQDLMFRDETIYIKEVSNPSGGVRPNS
jgi:hypothetical protein